MTDSKTIFGENRLFATLDTTTHSAVLPSRLKIVLADTIGFISDLPIQLFASFTATLQYVCNAVSLYFFNIFDFYIYINEILGFVNSYTRSISSKYYCSAQ